MRRLFVTLASLHFGCSIADGSASAPRRNVTIIYADKDDGTSRLPCPIAQCAQTTIADDTECKSSTAVVVSGHSEPPLYLGTDPARLAAQIMCHRPEIIVLDTCYGFSSPLLFELARLGFSGLIVGTIHKVPVAGLGYAPEFFESKRPHELAKLVGTDFNRDIQRWTVDPGDLLASYHSHLEWTSTKLRKNLERIAPNLVRVPLLKTGRVMLVPVAPERFR